VKCDAFLQESGHLLLLKEYAALLYEPRAEEGASNAAKHPLEGKIGAIFRESVCHELDAALEAVPFTALMLVESDGRPFIADWLISHGTDRWVDRLLEVMLIPIWHMLVHCGVALEAHAQNLILVHKNGWPEQIILRDFHEATEFVSEYLAKPQLLPDFASLDPFFNGLEDDVGYRMASTEALRELVMDTLYVFNLSDLSFLLERFCDFKEQDFWTLVRARLLAYKLSGVTDPCRIERIGSSAAEMVVESLLTKKFRDGGELDYFEHTIKNTLQGCG
jgi:siderophore synthetase component